MRAGMAKVQEGDGRGGDLGRMRLSRGMVKKGASGEVTRFEGLEGVGSVLRGRKEHDCGDECTD